ncbi:(2Fe-2S)-binding protein [Marinovum sp. 2_MG-2023]|uniref:(2Fe-2S)-binding protein n=1 Tax=Roseobacteraceae TaxID=2854170 RepID=UPI001FD1B8DF|nr:MULTISPECIES: (2Fe-2S)-binding protein [Roseobacteraceae]MCJ7872553.1 (2Fe-2S)-binding protein [Phaeobacter sp. J2-8]MDO6730232.1 (2Fe-2S)-binding protein [Marinovum sp. 2_MG-2023]MDO6778970.1 (2Fe-2S)-binding protein [Marinovum sp. 1_MG-2023]
MIVCHCQNIRDTDIHAAMDWMRAADSDTIITPGKIYRALGKRADCGGCLPLFLDTMANSPSIEVPANLQNLRDRKKRSTSR